MRTFIAFAFATMATLSTARAADQKQTVEADNGAIYEILYTTRDPNAGHAEAHVLTRITSKSSLYLIVTVT